MSRIDSIFADLQSKGRRALMPFITAGHPSLEATTQAIAAMEHAGASIVELGIPFSDPIADGPVIAQSMHHALQAGVTPAKVFAAMREIRSRVSLGIVAMVSQSIVQRMSPERFVAAAGGAGFDGLIVPDVDADAAEAIAAIARRHSMSFSMLVAPTTAEARIDRIVSLCSGFVYLVARVGITGESAGRLADDLASRVQAVRARTRLPVAVGFGVSSAAHVREVTQLADAAIVGSALVRRMAEAANPAQAAGDFVGELAKGLASSNPAGGA
jgi:tryptophan synthase alpha chain